MAHNSTATPDEVVRVAHELTAPLIQRIARKGVSGRLSEEECAILCECVVYHIDSILERSRRPKTFWRRPR